MNESNPRVASVGKDIEDIRVENKDRNYLLVVFKGIKQALMIKKS